MRQPRILMLILLLATLLPLSRASAQQRTVLVVVESDYPPFTFVNEEGELAGFSIELMDTLAEAGGFQVKYEVLNFAYIIPAVATRLYDVGISCIFIRPARQALVNFSDPYYLSGLWLISLENSGLTSIDDVTPGSKVGTVRGTAGEIFARQQAQAELVLTDIPERAFDLLVDASVVAVIYERESMVAYQAEHPEVRLRTVGNPLTLDECGIAIHKGELRRLLTINEALAQIRADGRYDRIYRKWFGELPPVDRAEVVEVAGATIPPVTAPQAITQTTILTSQVAGVYYLTLPTDPVTYQIVTLTTDGLWLGAETGQSSPSPTGNDFVTTQQQGVWQISSDNRVAATVLAFAPSGDAQASAGILRKEYQLTINVAGWVSGSYTSSLYSLAQNPLNATVAPSQTVTVEFTGQQVQVTDGK